MERQEVLSNQATSESAIDSTALFNLQLNNPASTYAPASNLDFSLPHPYWNLPPPGSEEQYRMSAPGFAPFQHIPPFQAQQVSSSPPLETALALQSADQVSYGITQTQSYGDITQAIAKQQRAGARAHEINTDGKSSTSASVSSQGSQRRHYAVEKRYRLALNETYAVLARTVSREDVQRICQAGILEDAAEQDDVSQTLQVREKDPAGRQSKTNTLSVALKTIQLLERCCHKKVEELEGLSGRLSTISASLEDVLATPSTEDDEEGQIEDDS